MKKDRNMMEFIPIRNQRILWEDKNSKVILKIPRDSAFEKVMHKIFKRPEVISLELEEIGSEIWKLCNGENNIYNIDNKIKEVFGERIEPSLPRLLNYIKILNDNKCIIFK
ncbi:PqqD family peptide modification chaperone [Clostridium hydrogeniformans]|uniref:PqqD family peptide modification chaperone n=1 Tax=Clostridium hydrogeniformans TaxID=349933 RepID=UPI000482B21B|nr:PqqD family peptide modification chaperone [Clostridium hydrogeniformans]